jgi:hypothetical protein
MGKKLVVIVPLDYHKDFQNVMAQQLSSCASGNSVGTGGTAAATEEGECGTAAATTQAACASSSFFKALACAGF